LLLLLLLLFQIPYMLILGVEPHCRCIETESRRIGPRIAKFELISANSHCERLEIIATLKQSGKEVCLNPEAPWVRKLIENMIPKPRLPSLHPLGPAPPGES
uniref:Chemokine interleukin-8-like domain-containing protein n=1 Tax=Nothobranchius furzeri TaxID=105023 RepID=A0A8C6L4E6_NOTFU